MATTTNPSTAPARVLLIEDDALDQSLFKRTLKQTQAEVVCVDRLDVVLAKLREEKFDLVVSDLGLPDSAWEQTFERLSAASMQVPVVAITGHEELVKELGDGHAGPYVFLKSAVHHDLFPLVVLGRILGHALDGPDGGEPDKPDAAPACPEV